MPLPEYWWIIGGIGALLLLSRSSQAADVDPGDIEGDEWVDPSEVQAAATSSPIPVYGGDIPTQQRQALERAMSAVGVGRYKCSGMTRNDAPSVPPDQLVTDCSGFTAWVLQPFIANFPKGSVAQGAFGQEVSRDVAMVTPGLVALDENASYGPYRHSAITTGDGRLIEALGCHKPQYKLIGVYSMRSSVNRFRDPWPRQQGGVYGYCPYPQWR